MVAETRPVVRPEEDLLEAERPIPRFILKMPLDRVSSSSLPLDASADVSPSGTSIPTCGRVDGVRGREALSDAESGSRFILMIPAWTSIGRGAASMASGWPLSALEVRLALHLDDAARALLARVLSCGSTDRRHLALHTTERGQFIRELLLRGAAFLGARAAPRPWPLQGSKSMSPAIAGAATKALAMAGAISARRWTCRAVAQAARERNKARGIAQSLGR